MAKFLSLVDPLGLIIPLYPVPDDPSPEYTPDSLAFFFGDDDAFHFRTSVWERLNRTIPHGPLEIAGTGGNPCTAEPLHIDLRVTSPYGPRMHNGLQQFHTGVDYAAPIGTAVYSVSRGDVALAYPSRTAGNVIDIITPLVGSSVYMHLSSINVSPGQNVDAGQQIGRSGNSGESSGPHLHFEQHSLGQIFANGVFNHATLIAPCQ